MKKTPTKIKVIVHDAEEGGYWAEVPALPGCASQGETLDELLDNLREAISGYLAAEVKVPRRQAHTRVLELAL
jgi:predicted RNase H-like HicB family nuclease